MPDYESIPPETPFVDSPLDPPNDTEWDKFEKARRSSFENVDAPSKSTLSRMTTVLKAVEHTVVITLLVILPFFIWTSGTTTTTKAKTAGAGFVPDFPFSTPVSFKDDERFTSKFQKAHPNNNSWSEYMSPRDGGWIRVPNAAKYGLTGGLPLPHTKTEDFAVSVFHGLHCLGSLQMTIMKLQEGKKADEIHIDHCINYIRQSLMCMGDMTLETPLLGDDGKLEHNVDGLGNVHVCRNFDDIVDWMNEHGDEKGPMPGVTRWAGKERMKKEDLA